jgi:hypothetical protein
LLAQGQVLEEGIATGAKAVAQGGQEEFVHGSFFGKIDGPPERQGIEMLRVRRYGELAPQTGRLTRCTTPERMRSSAPSSAA